ncbi:NAD(P)H-dependent oxidoreductase [Streptomyces sp. NPDC048514]|uniref:NAD(P)H-dependent oxidoreductase n=1 Tax=Streptomyces sp. NPDC048514 TaxID=3365564 RepID=UPI0037190584
MSHRVAVVYHSRRGSVRALAALAAEGAREAGAEVRLLRVADDEAAGRGWPERPAEPEDVVWADGLVLATPTYYGNVSSAFKRFLESTAPLWRQGLLADRVATGITVSTQRHGGREATLMALQHTLYHWGCWVAGADPADPVTRAAGGTAYGLAAGNRRGEPAPHERAAARALGHRLSTVAARVRARAAPQALTAVPGRRPSPPGESATPTTPAPDADPTTPAPDAEPTAPAPDAEPTAPAPDAEPTAPAPEAKPTTPAPDADPTTPAPDADPTTPAPDAEPTAPAPDAEPGAVSADAEQGAVSSDAEPGAVSGDAEPGAASEDAEPGDAASGVRPAAGAPGTDSVAVGSGAGSRLLPCVTGPVRLVVVYHGADAATRILAQEAAAAARAIGARVRLRRIPGPSGAPYAEWPGPWAASAEPGDIAWADAVLLGACVRLGALGAPLLDFVQALEPAHGGRSPLWGKPASGFATTPARHAGSETAVLDLGHMLLHAGALLVPPGYTDPAVEAAGGNPYGVSHPRSAGDLPTPEALAAAAHQGRRTALAGDLLRRTPHPRRAARRHGARPDPEPVRLAPGTTGRSTA